jgi:hypothetical protein
LVGSYISNFHLEYIQFAVSVLFLCQKVLREFDFVMQEEEAVLVALSRLDPDNLRILSTAPGIISKFQKT